MKKVQCRVISTVSSQPLCIYYGIAYYEPVLRGLVLGASDDLSLSCRN
jgi:hypothetical protein